MSNMDIRKTSNERPKCPECDSKNIAGIFWGMPVFDEKLEHDLDAGLIVLGGCCVTGEDPEWHCNDCGCEFDANPQTFEN